jgi:hypothetical protein
MLHGGTFVWETDALGHRRLREYQFNAMTLSVQPDDVYFGKEHANDLRACFANLSDPYLEQDGLSIGVAIDRLGSAYLRPSAVDKNLDLCIAAEIAFLYGVKDVENERIAEDVREHASLFFGEGEFMWSRDDVRDILRDSYRERSNTVHGRKFDTPERQDVLGTLNARLREVLKATLRVYAARRPPRLLARRTWPERRTALEAGEALGPIFLA